MKQKLKNLISKSSDKIRFILVGSTNTAIDFAVLFFLTSIGLSDLTSNFISTSVALTFSFFANKKFTFQDKTDDKLQFIRFLTVTLVGLWIIQPLIIELTKMGLNSIINNSKIILFIGKLLATGFTLIWNYLLYKKFVYKNNKD